MCRLALFTPVCVLLIFSYASAQTGNAPARAGADTAAVAPDPAETISYAADTIVYDVDDSTLVLSGNATLQYGAVTLTAGQIRFNTQTEILTAEALTDSTAQARTNGPPTLKDTQGTLTGDRMVYGIKTQRGRIVRGRTRYNEGFFYGEQLRVSDNLLKVNQGIYSTCDLPDGHRHYTLNVKQAKVLPDDKAIVKDVTARVFGVPVFYMPFYVLPLKRGRHSGFTIPNYGTSVNDGTYVRNFGYYWAASDYWDLKATGEFTSDNGLLLRPRLRYADAQRLRGDISGSYRSGYDLNTTGWDVQASHWQTLRPDLQVSGRAEFANSLDFVNATTRGTDPGRLRRALRSNLAVDKRWGQKSLNLTVSEVTTNEQLVRPTTTLNLRLPTRPLISPPQRRRPVGGFPDMNPPPSREPSWLQSVLLGYNARFQDQRTDSVTTRQALNHQFNLSAQQTIAGWLKFQPNGSYSEAWTRTSAEVFDRRNAYTAGVRTNTTLYGLFEPHIGGLQAVRHVMTPSLSFTQSGPANVSRFLNFSLNNVLQAKTVRDERERKFDLVYVNFSTGYNFKAATRPLSDLLTSIRIPNRAVNLDASLTHDFYEPVVNTFRSPWLKRASVTTSFNLRGGGVSTPELPPGAATDPASQTGAPGQTGYDGPAGAGIGAGGYVDDRYDEQFDRVTGPWSVALTHRYSVARSAPSAGFTTDSHVISASNRINLDPVMNKLGIRNRLTHKWRVEHSVNYDIRRREIVSQNFNFYRNLHCWELFIRWTPDGFNKGIYFRLNIRAHPEIKIEQQRLSG